MNDNKTAAAYHGAGRCPRSCCWTPFGTCARGWTCDHHKAAATQQTEQDTAEDWEADLERRLSLTERRWARP